MNKEVQRQMQAARKRRFNLLAKIGVGIVTFAAIAAWLAILLSQ